MPKKHSEYKIKIIDKENGGVSVARNTAMQVTKGKYIYFVDSDDYIAANTLHIALENMEKYDLDIFLTILNWLKILVFCR